MDVKVYKGQGKLQHIIDIGPHRLLTDESPQHGGEDTAPIRTTCWRRRSGPAPR